MKDVFITIASFDNPVEANIAKGKLESQGIISFLRDENTISIVPSYTYAIGNIRLQIHKQDLSHAITIMRNNSIPLIDDFKLKEENLKKASVMVCPNCYSDNHYKKVSFFRSGNKCFDCGYEWKEKKT